MDGMDPNLWLCSWSQRLNHRGQESSPSRRRSSRAGSLLAICLGTLAAPAASEASDLLVTLSAIPATIVLEQEVRLQILVTNLGPESATDIQVETLLPPEVALLAAQTETGTCSPGTPVICQFGNLSATETSRTATILLQARAVSLGEVVVTTRVDAGMPDPVPSNNADTLPLRILAPGDASDLRLTLSTFVAFQNSSIIHFARLDNDGPRAAGPTTTVLKIPELSLREFGSASVSTFGSTDTAIGSCRTELDSCIGDACQAVMEDPLHLECQLDGLGVGEWAEFTFSAFNRLEPGDPISLIASVSGTELADPDLGNNRAETSTQVSPPLGTDIDLPDEWVGPACFIATAAFGSPYAVEVQRFRNFRDRYLMPHAPGRWLVAQYYRLSPPWADWLRANPIARQVVALALLALLWVMQPLPALGLTVLGGLCLCWRRNPWRQRQARAAARAD